MNDPLHEPAAPGTLGGLRLISANDHLLEPPDVWVGRLAGKWAEQGPVLVEVEDGTQAWRFGDALLPVRRLATVAGEDMSTYSVAETSRYEDLKRGSWDPKERLVDMDRDGVEKHLCQPTILGFGGAAVLKLQDLELAGACLSAYNDWVIDVWSATDPTRLPALAIVPMWDAQAAGAEARRIIDRGACGIVFVEDPTALGFPGFHDRYWNPLLAVLEETGTPLVMHMNTVPVRMVQGRDTPFGVDLTLMYCTSMATMVNLLFSPVFLDFPGLKVVLPEGGLGWVPFMLEKADFLWDRHRSYARGALTTQVAPPSELYVGRIFSTIQSHDDAGLELRDRLGVDQILWQCDYPHADSTWPETHDVMGSQLAGLSPEDRAAIMGRNALRVFQLDQS